jgi:ketosteroid isomerase-like protein
MGDSTNMAVTRASQEAYERGGIEAYLDYLSTIADPAIVWREDPTWPDHAEVVGIDAIRELMRERFESTEFDVVTEELVDGGDRVLSLQRWSAKGRSSGASAALDVATVTSFEDSRVVAVDFYLDRDRARRDFDA